MVPMLKPRRVVVRLGLVAAVALGGCYEPVAFVASRSCSVLADCPDDSACVLGRCEACPQCASGERCLKGQCLPSLCAGATCPEGQGCLDGRCTPASCVGLTCESGQRCEAGACVACAAVDSCVGGADDDCDGKAGCLDEDCAGKACGVDGPCVSLVCQSGTCASLPKAQGTVCRASAGACDLEERCDGSSTACPGDQLQPTGFECQGADGPCEDPASCSGASPSCPAKAFKPATFVCGAKDGDCDEEDRCTGSSAACPDALVASGEVCHPSTGPCDPAEVCDGAGKACPGDSLSPANTPCGTAVGCRLQGRCDGLAASCPTGPLAGPGTVCRASQGACDVEEACDGASPDCPADARQGVLFECAASAGPCELSSFCDGASPACPAKQLLDGSTVCAFPAGQCDVEERCSGTSAACPADQVQGATFVCRATTGVCDPEERCDGTGKVCPADVKLGSATVCSAALACRLEARCDGTNGPCPTPALAGPGTVCRAGAGPCEADALCTGSSEGCPANLLKGPADSCRASLGPCDPEERCDGLAAACPADVRRLATEVCDPATGPCETTSYCDGSGALCPAKTFLGSSTVCSPSGGACDPEERCTGTGAACPADGVREATFVCRPSQGACDPEEKCDGSGKACPAEVRLGPADRCAAASGECENDAFCDGASAACPAKSFKTTTCRPATDLCDEPESCTGASATCPNDLVSVLNKPCGVSAFCDGTNKTCPSGAPAAPVFVSINPTSPSNASTTPAVKGTSSADTVTVKLYSNSACTTQVGSGNKADWEGAGVTATVPANQSTVLYAKATNAVPLDSACAEMTTYVHDNLGPAAPAFVATVPATPTGPSFTVKGTSSADTANVTVYMDSGCATQVGTGAKALWEGGGVPVTLSPNVTTTLYGKAFDALGNASACVLLTTYTAVRAWTWVAGPSTTLTKGVATAKGVAAATDFPGSRQRSVTWARGAEVWTFGGYGCSSINCSIGYLNDLWRFDGTNWTWMSGTASSTNQNGVYGTKGVAAAANTPGSRSYAATAVDGSGNLWLFGGWAYGASGNKIGEINDLWKYDGTNWTWVSGGTCSSETSGCDPFGVYGTKGVAAAANVPGGRDSALGWVDASGRFWLFGGTGCDVDDCVTNTNTLNDVWMYDPSTGWWTWMAGSTTANGQATYGTKGVAAPGNVPAGRYYFGGFYSASAGGLFAFGGYGYDSTATAKFELSDLWRYDGANFAWVGGPTVGDQLSVPGTKGVAAPTNWPGSRDSFAMAGNASGRGFLFGGNGCTSAACDGSLNVFLGDLWEWDGAAWAWLAGSASATDEAPVFGTRGVPDAANAPGARARLSGAATPAGAYWIFGGDSPGGLRCDLWRYQ